MAVQETEAAVGTDLKKIKSVLAATFASGMAVQGTRVTNETDFLYYSNFI